MRSKRFAVLVLCFGFVGIAQALAGEDDIRGAFGQLQKAVKARDAEKIWDLVDSDTQADAGRAAKAVGAAYVKSAAKADFEKKYGLSAKELADMSGKLFIKSNRFHGKYYEVPDSKITGVTVKGDTAKLMFVEEDGDKITFPLVKQKGAWKFILKMPKAVD